VVKPLVQTNIVAASFLCIQLKKKLIFMSVFDSVVTNVNEITLKTNKKEKKNNGKKNTNYKCSSCDDIFGNE
jgi:hypothetical protein